jgi:AraC-like DNA-binding protein
MLDAAENEPPPSPPLSYTLQHVPVRRRFPMMREMMADGHPPFMRAVLTATREDPDAPFDGGFLLRTKGELACCEHYSEAVSYTRTASGAATSPIDVYGVFLMLSGVWHLTQGGQTRTIEAGSMVLMDSNVPFLSVKPGKARLVAIRIPHRQIDSLIRPGWQRHGVVCAAQPGLDGLVTQYARVLSDEIDRFSAAEADAALDNLCRLLALQSAAQTNLAGPAEPALHAARLVQIRRHIDQHLADPALTPASVAAAHRMSLRSLHLLFEPTGLSCARHILQRRLQECHAMLAGPAHAHRSVTDIAFAWGFNSLTTFYSAFQRQFGVAPGDLRRAMDSRHVAPPERPYRTH